MKKAVLLIGLFAVILPALSAQDASLPRLAVMEFTTNVNTEKVKADAIAVRNQVESRLAETRKYRMMTRNEIDQLLKNQRIQVSDISSAENLTKLRLEQVNYIITGSVDAMGDDYSVTVRVLDVSNGEYPNIKDELMGSGSRELRNGVNNLMAEFIGGMSTEGDRITQTRQWQGSTNIGDRGPGGGFIFYAENGVYMEVSQVLGSYNWDQAIEVAKNYKGGGFTDWRLPSRNELEMIYQNLRRRKNMTGLGDDIHWSSSQFSPSNAWYQRFSNGSQYNGSKGTTFSVRAIRQF